MIAHRKSVIRAAGLAAVLSALCASPPPAAAQPAPVALGSELASLTLGIEQLVIAVPIVINLSQDNVARPINAPVDVYYGVSDVFMLGLSHSSGTIQGVGPYGLALGLCLTAEGCGGKAYNNVGLDLVYRMLTEAFQLAFHGGADFNSFSPVILRLRVGLAAKAPLATNVALLLDPRLAVGLTDRGPGADVVTTPLAVQILTSTGARFAMQAGIDGPLDDFANAYTGWLGAFGALGVNEKIEAFASFTFPNLYGKRGGIDARVLVLGLNIRP